jgi:clan AA aspartic protease (TIGR02281 family)
MGAPGPLILAGCAIIGAVVGLAHLPDRDTSTSGIAPPLIPDSFIPRPSAPTHKSSTVRYRADGAGQFWIPAKANGVRMQFLVDTGAGNVVFSKTDAARLGIDVDHLSFDGRSSTANGTVRTAKAQIASLSVGPFTFIDVWVSINDGDLDFPLLGMAFLRRLNVAIGKGVLTLSDAL